MKKKNDLLKPVIIIIVGGIFLWLSQLNLFSYSCIGLNLINPLCWIGSLISSMIARILDISLLVIAIFLLVVGVYKLIKS